jgi:hypothetical protein
MMAPATSKGQIVLIALDFDAAAADCVAEASASEEEELAELESDWDEIELELDVVAEEAGLLRVANEVVSDVASLDEVKDVVLEVT